MAISVCRPSIFEKPFKRANDLAQPGCPLVFQGFPTIQTAVAGDCQDGRIPIVHAPAGRFEIHKRRIAVIDSNHDAGRTKIKAYSHGNNIVAVGHAIDG